MTIHPPARLVGEPKKTKKKKERKEGRKTPKTVANWLFAQTIHVVGSKSHFAWCVGLVIHVKCDPNRLKGFTALWECGGGIENGSSPLLWAVAYTTACTTVQTVMLHNALQQWLLVSLIEDTKATDRVAQCRV